jgi:hypothetical protein
MVGAMVAVTGCVASSRSMPDCDGDTRLAIMAQSVPAAAYVPCVTELPAGWSFADLQVNHRGATIGLDSDRADRRVNVDLVPACDTDDATPIAPSDAGTRSYQSIDSIDPRYAGRFIDVFPGGCVVTHYDFERGAHVALITEIQQIVGLYSRRQLRQDLESQLDIQLDP